MTGYMRGRRLLGNRDKRELHDLDRETRHCQIDAIIDAGHDHPFVTWADALASGYDPCTHCLGRLKP
jgi:hypothetical protein